MSGLMSGWPRCELLRTQLAGSEVVVAPGDELEHLLAQAITGARAAWPTVAVSEHGFLGHLAHVLQQGAARSVEDWLARGTASDLYLACGCAAGDRAALAAFETHFLSGLDATLGRLDVPAWVIDDVKQEVRRKLLVGEDARPPRIADFTGAGNLRGWLRVVAINAARQILRRVGPAPATTDLVDVVPPVADDPELEILKTHYREQFRAAFAVALAELPARDRTLLRQHYLLGLGIGEIGAMYGVHRGTAARWLDRSTSALLGTTRRTLATRLRVDRTDVDSILRLVRSQLEVSIRSALAAEDA
jgi:RNA polymerase sigma-70 factor (ECF subfamily)